MGTQRQPRVGVSWFVAFQNIWNDWNDKNANNFLLFKTWKNYTYQGPLFIAKSYLRSNGGRTKISDIQRYLKTKFPQMQTIFVVLKHQKICL